MGYIRKPDGEKRGSGNTRKGTIGGKKTFPAFPTSKATPAEDRPAHDRHMRQIVQQYKHSHPNKQVSI